MREENLLKVQYLCDYNNLILNKAGMDICFLDCNHTKAQKDGIFARHMHLSHELLFIRKGIYQCSVNNENFCLAAGDMIIIQPGQYHEDFFSKGCELFGFHFNTSYGTSVFAAGTSVSEQILHLQEDRFTKSLLFTVLKFLHNMDAADNNNFSVGNSLFMALLCRLISLFAAANKNLVPKIALQSNITDRINSVFGQNISRFVSIDTLCRQCGMSRSTLHRICLKHYNMPPVKAFVHYKMQQAVEVMRRNPGIKIKELSAEFGFKNAFHFSRVFKRELGKSPMYYLRGFN